MKKIEVIGREISIASRNEEDFISITDIAKNEIEKMILE